MFATFKPNKFGVTVVMKISIGTDRFKKSVLIFIEEELGHQVA